MLRDKLDLEYHSYYHHSCHQKRLNLIVAFNSYIRHFYPLHSGPIGLQASDIKTTFISLSWDRIDDPKAIIKAYQVSYTQHGKSERLQDIAGNTTSTELTGLRPHTECTIRVRAKAAVDYGEYSIPITARTHEDGELIWLLSIMKKK